MTDGKHLLRGAELVSGAPVIYDGPDISQPYHFGESGITTLRKGHPGRVFDPEWHHIRVNWVSLEDAPISYAAGFTLEKSEEDPEGVVPGLVLISDAEYEALEVEYRKIASESST